MSQVNVYCSRVLQLCVNLAMTDTAQQTDTIPSYQEETNNICRICQTPNDLIYCLCPQGICHDCKRQTSTPVCTACNKPPALTRAWKSRLIKCQYLLFSMSIPVVVLLNLISIVVCIGCIWPNKPTYVTFMQDGFITVSTIFGGVLCIISIALQLIYAFTYIVYIVCKLYEKIMQPGSNMGIVTQDTPLQHTCKLVVLLPIFNINISLLGIIIYRVILGHTQWYLGSSFMGYFTFAL